jgi:hypothetical protein
MWLMRALFVISLLNVFDAYAGPKNFGFKIHKHYIEGLELPMPRPRPIEEGEMVAKEIQRN